MFCTLMLDGVPLGQVEITGAPSAVGFLSPFSGYTSTGFARHASRLGLALRVVGSSKINSRTVARALAGAIAHFSELQPRLSLVDIRGGNIAIIHIVLAQFPRDNVPVVVAELREQASQVAAALRLREHQDAGTARPAA